MFVKLQTNIIPPIFSLHNCFIARLTEHALVIIIYDSCASTTER